MDDVFRVFKAFLRVFLNDFNVLFDFTFKAVYPLKTTLHFNSSVTNLSYTNLPYINRYIIYILKINKIDKKKEKQIFNDF